MIVDHAMQNKKASGNTLIRFIVEFDHKNILRWFEAATEELLRLKKKVRNRIDDNEDAINASEVTRRKKAQDIKIAFRDLKTAFEGIESRLSLVGKTAIRIGDITMIDI
jgi:hypothetical protein